jgi:hypothetical protein
MADRDGAEAGALAERELERQLATLTLAAVAPSGPVEAASAATWWNLLARLGLRPPLVVVHDLGLLLTRARQGVARQVRRVPVAPGATLERYEAFLAAVAASDTLEDVQAAPLADETIAVILASLLGDVHLRWSGRPRAAPADALPGSSPAFERDRGALARQYDPTWALGFLQRLVEQDRGVLARLEQLEAGALRLLGLFALDAGPAGGTLAEL